MRKACFIFIVVLSALYLGCKKGDSAATPNNSSSGKSGSIARMTIVGNYLYIVNHSDLKVYNISDPANMSLQKTVSVGFEVETIYPYNDKLFIGSTSAMYIYDISDPRNPARQGAVSHLRACDPVVTDGAYAYVTLRNNNSGCGGTQNVLNVYDISGGKVLTPVLLSTTNLPQPYGLSVHDSTLYVCCGEAGLAVVNVKNKRKPDVKKVIALGKSYTDAIVVDNILFTYVTGGLALFDISDQQNPQFISEIKNNNL